MKKLYVIGFTADNDGLVLSPRKGAKSGGFVVVLDDDLLSSIETARRQRDGVDTADTGGRPGSDLGVRGARPGRSRSALSPREIQARLRAGSSVGEVARKAGVDDEWILRFAAPILAEQARVVESAQRLTLAKSRRGPSIEPLAESVRWNLSDRGVRFSPDVFADNWTAYNLHGARWAVRFSYTSRKRQQAAEWEVDLRELSLVARNRLATELGHVVEGRRRPSVDVPETEAPEAGASAASQRKASGSGPRASSAKKVAGRVPVPAGTRPAPRSAPAGARTAGATRRARPGGATPPAKSAPLSRTAAPKSAATKAAATKAAATKSPPSKSAATKAAATKSPPSKSAATKAAATKSAATKAPATKAPATKSPATKAPPAPKGAGTSAARGGAGANQSPGAAQRAGRESSPRRARPAKKPPGDTPGLATAGAGTPGPTSATVDLPDRPSHLARPPSPMKRANRATNYPGQRQAGSYGRQMPSRPQSSPPASAAAPSSAPAKPSIPANPRSEASEPAGDGPAPRAVVPAPGTRPRPAPPRPEAVADGGERPAVVILSTPAQRAAGRGPDTTEGRARLASADRLRSSPGQPAAPPGDGAPPAPSGDGTGVEPAARRRARRPAGA